MRQTATTKSSRVRTCNQSVLPLFLHALIVSFMFGLSVQAQEIEQSVIAGGGGKSSAETRQMEGTIGQSVVGTSSGGGFKVEGGFWRGGPVTTVSVVSLDAVSGVYGGSVTLKATLSASGSGLNGKLISFALDGTAVGSATTGSDGVATLSNVSLSGVIVGVYPVAAQFAGDAELSASNGSAELTVGKADQVINFGALANQTLGAAPFTVTATTTSGLYVIFSIESGPASLISNTVTINGAGTVVVRASQAGDGNYNAANPVDQSFQVVTDTPCNKVNVALASLGATATASSAYNGNYPASGVIDGEHDSNNWGLGGGWNDATAGVFPDSVEVLFPVAKKIHEIVVYTLKDDFNSGSVVNEETQFTKYGITAFQVQYWNGAEFVDVPDGVVTGNNQVERRFSFAEVTTEKIRIVVNDGGNDQGYYSRVVEVEAYACNPVPPPCPSQTNVALAERGATATASSEFSSAFPASGVIDGEHDGNNWAMGGGWNDATAGVFPDNVEVQFNGPQTLREIVVYTLKDDFNSGSAVNDATQFTGYGIRNFTVEYWNGSNYVAVPGGVVTGNTQVKRKFVFPELTTERIRIVVNDGNDNFGYYSRVVEVEAYSSAYLCDPVQPPCPNQTNVALTTSGATATATSEYSSAFPVSGVIDGEYDGNNWAMGGGWNDATAGEFPDSVEVHFNGPQALREIVVYTLKDDFNSGTKVSDSTRFTLYGISNFRVQYWTGTEWLDIPGGMVTGNRHVKRRFVFPELTTAKIRVVVQDAANNAGHYSRIVEIQALSCGPLP